MTRTLLTLLFSSMLAGSAFADDAVVGKWTGGSMELSVDQNGRFDWSVGPLSTDGHWVADDHLVSMRTEQGQVTYGYNVKDDELTLFEASGTELVMKREKKRKRSR